MKKTTTILSTIFLIIFSAVCACGATIVDQDDFESYNIGDSEAFINSTIKWNCTTNYPTCKFQDIGGGDASVYYGIENDGDNFLRVRAWNGTNTDWESVRLYWNHDNVSALGDVEKNYSYSFNYKLNGHQKSRLSGGSLGTYAWGSVENSGLLFGGGAYIRLGSGGSLVGSTTDENWTRFRGEQDGGVLKPDLPSANCSVNDGQWHYIVVHMYFNASSTFRDYNIYVDGNHCWNRPVNNDFSSTAIPLVLLHVDVGKVFDISLDDLTVYEGDADIEEPIITCTTNCTAWSSPYRLRESFEGYINTCDWATTENICFDGTLSRIQSNPYYSAFKNTDLIESSDSRYVTIAFDIKPTNIASNGWVGVSIYDEDYQRFIQFLFGENGTMYNNEDGDANEKYSNTSISLSKTVNLHIDFTDDDFDLWYDGNKVSSSLGFTDSFLNIDNVYGVRLSSDNAVFEIDNLEVYGSDQNNNPLLPDEELVSPVNENKSWCNLFSHTVIECTQDSDCSSDSCLPNGKCNRFDMTYCDENGHKRGNYCMVAGMTSCVLENTSDLILDHFLLFLVLLILIVLGAYVIFTLRG